MCLHDGPQLDEDAIREHAIEEALYRVEVQQGTVQQLAQDFGRALMSRNPAESRIASVSLTAAEQTLRVRMSDLRQVIRAAFDGSPAVHLVDKAAS